ncbi:MAG TPA: AI-2E family transporter [Virgibacillus sp.]|nr:AI-2E family transporter [Virgibacillus sp.]
MQNKRWFQTLVLLILIFLLILLLSKTSFIFDPMGKYIGAVAVPIIGAGILYYLTKPVMHFFENKLRIHRILAILLVFLILTCLLFLFILYIFPIAQHQIENLIHNIPKMVKGTQNLILSLQSNQIIIPEQIDDAINDFMNNIQVYVENAISYLFGIITHLVTLVLSLFLIPFFLFFMLKDGDKLVPFITQIFKKKKADNIKRLLGKIDVVLTGFIQGQLIVSFFLGILLFIGYLVIGLNYALTIALFGMLMNVIPFLGPFLAVIPALLVAFFQDPIMVVWVAIITLIAQQIESNLISPNVMGRVLALHPLTVITVILAAGGIAGFLGILFAVPFYAIIKTIFVHFYKTFEHSQDDKADSLL